ncbi:hypothetical protein pipiens_006630 [Culex pipiens pipiens]|uniref:Nuclease HARBI1 n=1 Tax=Culex pipiens pipiens TaxID=38569 RepID=A0ABD1DNT3_CULPP
MEYMDSDSSSEDQLTIMGQILVQAQIALISTEESSVQRGARKGKRPNIDRGARNAARQLEMDYFAENATYRTEFRRRFRMSRAMFIRVAQAVEAANPYFVQRPDATGKMGLTCLQKCTAANRQLAYGTAADATDEYVRLSESTARNCLLEYCRTVVAVFEEEYLRTPNAEDVARLLEEGRKRGFPGMLGSLDCCHWQWKNCPTAWAGQYKGKEKKPSIILEAVASQDLWIWHAFFGMPGSNNDINVLERSPLFTDLYSGKTPPIEYTVNNRVYTYGYYLADGIYPHLSTLVQTISAPVGQKRKNFAEKQEAARKDVERAFGVLGSRFAIVKNPARYWLKEDLAVIMRACIILHNMVVEDQRNDSSEEDPFLNGQEYAALNEDPAPDGSFDYFLSRYAQVHDTSLHQQLKEDLIEHLWQVKGEKDD